MDLRGGEGGGGSRDGRVAGRALLSPHKLYKLPTRRAHNPPRSQDLGCNYYHCSLISITSSSSATVSLLADNPQPPTPQVDVTHSNLQLSLEPVRDPALPANSRGWTSSRESARACFHCLPTTTACLQLLLACSHFSNTPLTPLSQLTSSSLNHLKLVITT